MLPILVNLFNHILNIGQFPKSWCEAIICPLYKGKGNPHDVKAYRGISLLNMAGFVLTKLLNNRLKLWATGEGLFFEEQSGYREGYSTADNLFCLQSVLQNYLSKPKGRLYCLYVDFSTAFDCVQHDVLWYVLAKNGLHGRVLNVLKSMYSQLESCVRTDECLSQNFNVW